MIVSLETVEERSIFFCQICPKNFDFWQKSSKKIVMSDINELIESGSVPLATPRKSKADLSPEPIPEIPEMEATTEDRRDIADDDGRPEVAEHDDSSSESSDEGCSL